VTPARTSVHPALLEDAIRDTLKDWLPEQFRRLEVENDLPARWIPEPRSWPVSSAFDLEPHEQLPAVFVVSTGKHGPAQRGPDGWRATWGFEVVVAVAGKDEEEARLIAGLELAAVRNALLWHPSLGGLAEHIEWGDEDPAVGTAGRGARAVFGAAFDVVIPQAVSKRPGDEPPAPRPEPYEPPPAAPTYDTADVAVTPHQLTEELA
jgi:hypothetical protein